MRAKSGSSPSAKPPSPAATGKAPFTAWRDGVPRLETGTARTSSGPMCETPRAAIGIGALEHVVLGFAVFARYSRVGCPVRCDCAAGCVREFAFGRSNLRCPQAASHGFEQGQQCHRESDACVHDDPLSLKK